MTDASTRASPLASYTVALVGCGQMGSAIVRGVISSGAVPASRLFLIDAIDAKARELARELGARQGWPGSEEGPRLVLLATKPKHAREAIERLPHTDQDLLVSVCAGIPLSLLRAWAPEPAYVVRTMPNTPALVGEGVTGVMGEPGADLAPVRALFESVGRVVALDEESDFDGLTAISGSGPAYVFTMLEALADGGVLMGLRREIARELAV
ncbi:MAG: pyrroline-5-carboxylate reductase dimerization domain-containing protein, partial [Myxococcota bacterium]